MSSESVASVVVNEAPLKKHLMVDIIITHWFVRVAVISTCLIQVGIQTNPIATAIGVGPSNIEFAATLLTPALGVILLAVLPLYWQERTDGEDLTDLLRRFLDRVLLNPRSFFQDNFRWFREKRSLLIDNTFIQSHLEGVPHSYRTVYGVTTLIDSFCYAFWLSSVAADPEWGGIEWDIQKAVALRLAQRHDTTLNYAEEIWLSRQKPHLAAIMTFIFSVSWTLLLWPYVWRIREKLRRRSPNAESRVERELAPPSNPLSRAASIRDSTQWIDVFLDRWDKINKRS